MSVAAPSRREIARKIARLPEPQRTIAAEKFNELYGRRDDEVEVVEGTFADYVARNNPTLLDVEHVPRLVSVGERIVTGELPRVIVVMPPRYWKTELFSRLLSGYFLRKHPRSNIGLASYGAELAWSISEDARNYFQKDGGKIRRETSAKKHWSTAERGEMWAAGVGGPLLGFGYDLGIVDDPTDPEKAHSPKYQRRFQEWWPAKWLSRQEPKARILVVMQRLGPEDPIDFLFRRELGLGTDRAPEHWHVVICDEIRSDEPLADYGGPRGLPPTCTIEPDPRPAVRKGFDVTKAEPKDLPPASVLAPSRFDIEAVIGMQRAAGAYVRDAQRQQRPSAPTGDFWKLDWFGTYDELPADAYNGGKDWDLAYTKDEANSASAFVESYRGPGELGKFPIYIHDADWEWLEFPELVKWMKEKSGPHYIEDKASGKSADQTLRRENISTNLVTVSGDKLARASSVQPVVSNRRIYVRSAIRKHLLEGARQGLLRVRAETLLAGGPDLDVNDVFVQAITRHVGSMIDPNAFRAPTKK